MNTILATSERGTGGYRLRGRDSSKSEFRSGTPKAYAPRRHPQATTERRVVHGPAAACALLLTVLSCGYESVSREDEASVSPEAPTVHLQADLRIGTAYGFSEEEFGHITALAVDDSGSVYVGDGRNYVVRKFDRAGAFLLEFGGRGEGPGEFDGIDGVAAMSDGRVAVVDGFRGVVSLFNSDSGLYDDQWTIPKQWLTWSRHAVVAREDGGLYIGLPPKMPRDGTPVAWPRPVFAVVDSLGSAVDTVWAPERYVERCGTRSSHAVRSGFYEDLRIRYVPKVVWTVNVFGDLFIGCPHTMQFDIVADDGMVMASEEVRIESVPVPPAELAWALDQIRASRSLAYGLAAVNDVGVDPVRQLLDYDYPKYKAAYKTLTAARNGSVWVRLSQRSKEFATPDGVKYWDNETGGSYEVFDRTGQYVGRATLPQDVWINPDLPSAVAAVIHDEHLWAVTLDSLNVQYVTRYRIGWPGYEGD